ncbi:MAG: flagellar motor switch protein FliM [candidate division Zixibacteria bacterium]|nr:flagellar motor switch protein FliM [candidate division Zixibacteria bacterium]
MVKILAQDEIDALIASAAGGEIEEEVFTEPQEQQRNVVSYDFKHPNRVNKDQIRTVESLHDNFANHLGSSFSAYTRTMVDVDLVAVDQITYSEYIMSLSAPSCSYIFQMDPLEGPGVININSSVAFFIVDRIFGGKGATLETERELTNIERSIMNKVLNKTMTALEKAWENIVPINMNITNYETNPQFIQIVPPGETVITVSLQVKMGETYGVMTICYPYITLESIVQKLSGQHWIDTSRRRNKELETKENIQRVKTMGANLSVQLQGTMITMEEILKVRVGDVICLDNSKDDEFTVVVEDQPKFRGRVGYLGKRRAVQLTSVIEPISIGMKELTDDKFGADEIQESV